VRDYAQVVGDGTINEAIAVSALGLEGIDQGGLDGLDKAYLHTIMEHYQGGPVGIEAIAATLNEEVDTLQDMVEPFLLKTGYINRSPSGRKVTPKTYQHFAR
jgi:Holliday junction DNA helicase RuvB